MQPPTPGQAPSRDESGAPRTTEQSVSDPPADPADLPPPQSARDAMAGFAELLDYVAYYLSVRIDLLRASIRRAAVLGILGLLAALVGCAAVVTASVLLCMGLAQALSAALGGRAWAGNLLFGAMMLMLVGVCGWIGLRWLRASLRKRMVRKYENRKARQRRDFGHDVEDRARQL